MSTITCPFCGKAEIPIEAGRATCPGCGAPYRIDARGEHLFVDLKNPRFPCRGMFCWQCGLVVPGRHRANCPLCGADIRSGAMQ